MGEQITLSQKFRNINDDELKGMVVDLANELEKESREKSYMLYEFLDRFEKLEDIITDMQMEMESLRNPEPEDNTYSGGIY